MMDEELTAIDWQLSFSEIKQRGGYLLNSGLWTDCTFVLGENPEKEIRAHRLVLAMASPVFEAMFYGSVAEGNTPILVPDIHPQIFQALLEYIYTDNIKIKSCGDACELYYSGQKYMLPHLKNVCVKFLNENLTTACVGKLYEFALLVDEKSLAKACEKLIQKETKAVISSPEFGKLLPDTVLKIFSMDSLNITSELQLFKSALAYSGIKTKTSYRLEFAFTVNDVRLLSSCHSSVHSRFYYVRDVPWRLLLRRLDAYLYVFLQTRWEARGGEEQPLSCKVRGSIALVAHNGSGRKIWNVKKTVVAQQGTWEQIPLNTSYTMKWLHLIDIRNGFVKDNSATFEVCLKVKFPAERSAEYFSSHLGDSHKQNTSSSGSSEMSIGTDISSSSKENRPQQESSYFGACSYEEQKAMARALIKHIRLLTLTPQDIVNSRALKPLLTDKEMLAVLMNVTSANTQEPMPEGFSTSRKKRSGPTKDVLIIVNSKIKEFYSTAHCS